MVPPPALIIGRILLLPDIPPKPPIDGGFIGTFVGFLLPKKGLKPPVVGGGKSGLAPIPLVPDYE